MIFYKIISIRGVGATLPFMVPYDSQYWEMSGKVGLNKKLNTLDIDWTVYGGYILSSGSDNNYKVQVEYSEEDFIGDKEDVGIRDNMDGDVRGYRIGSDLWIRHHVNEQCYPPFPGKCRVY